MLEPRAVFDYLSIVRRIGAIAGPVSEAEIHMFAYLACLLCVYRGTPASSWGYQFARTSSGSPFAKEITDAGAFSLDKGLISEVGGLRSLSSFGASLVSELSGFSQNRDRTAFLEAACSSTLAVSFGELRAALMEEPSLKNAQDLDKVEALISGQALNDLHTQFEALAKAVGADVPDLLVPSITWLTFLSDVRCANTSTTPSDS